MDTISTICRLTIQGKFYKMIGSRIFLVPVEDGETVHILDYDVTFFDILSTKPGSSDYHTLKTAAGSPAQAMSRTTRSAAPTWKAVTGCFTKPSACTATVISSNPMKNTTAR